jgi:hypothetical protein
MPSAGPGLGQAPMLRASGRRLSAMVILVSDFKPGRGVRLPLGFPGRWNYWHTPAKGRGGPDDRLRLEAVEHLQISLRPTSGEAKGETDTWADIASVNLLFE